MGIIGAQQGDRHAKWKFAGGHKTAHHDTPGEHVASQTAFEQEVAQLIVDTLNLEDVTAGEIEPEDALFRDGLGLDSIDALELALAISRAYGVQIRSDDENNRQIFASLRALSAHIEANRAAS